MIGHAEQHLQGVIEHWLPRESDCILYCREWKPDGAVAAEADLLVENFGAEHRTDIEQPTRNLLILHGACEHGGRYVSLAERASRAGWRVLLPDQRGHGRSTGQLVHVDRFSQYLTDLRDLLTEMNCVPEQTAIIGCSMGGLVSIRLNQWLQRETGTSACRQLWLISPLLGIKHPIAAWKTRVAAVVGQYFPRTRFRSTINPSDLTHNSAVLEQRALDPLLRKHVTARWYLEVNQALQEAFAQASDFTIPCVVWQAGEDRVVDPLAARAWSAWINQARGTSQVEFRKLNGWFHEILKEIEGDILIDQLVVELSTRFADHQRELQMSRLPA